MKLNSFEIFALLLCSCLLGMCLAVWTHASDLMTDREVSLIIAVYIAFAFSLAASTRSEDAIIKYISGHSGKIADKQMINLQEAHRKQIASLKHEHQSQQRQLQSSLDRAHVDVERVNREFDWMTDTYQEQMRTVQEQNDRITYLETKLQEYGHRSPGVHVPYSAPPSQIYFSRPPRRNRMHSGMASASPTISSLLTQVPESAEE